MKECNTCKIINGEVKSKKVYEDAIVYAVMPEQASSLGHIKVYPKQHIENIEDLNDDLITQMFFCASFAATAVFEGLGSEGTNIIINNGEAANQKEKHICIDVLPRKAEDGLNFQWEPKQLTPEDMNKTMEQIKDCTAFIGKKKPNKEDTISVAEPVVKHVGEQKQLPPDEDNYFTKKLVRIP